MTSGSATRLPDGWSGGDDEVGEYAVHDQHGVVLRLLPRGSYRIGMSQEEYAAPLPTVIAGVQRSVRRFVPDRLLVIGVIHGNHDRTDTTDLHRAAWPVVSDWVRTDSLGAVARLDDARSADRYAGGIAEIGPLAHDGRIDTHVVEAAYAMAARVEEHGQVQTADEPHHPDVHDDTIERRCSATADRQ